jgi:hypothetical protein
MKTEHDEGSEFRAGALDAETFTQKVRQFPEPP